MAFPVFAPGDVLNASDMNAVGLWKVAAASFSAVSAVNVNDVFTSEYENYRVTVRLTATGGTTTLTMKLRAGGTDTSSAYYFGGLSKTVGSNATTYFTDTNNASAATVAFSNGTGLRVLTLDFMGPRLNERTFFHGSYSDFNAAGHYTVGGSHLSAYQADGFSIIPGSAVTITGSYIVYGYRP
jgi:hypothetical protein